MFLGTQCINYEYNIPMKVNTGDPPPNEELFKQLHAQDNREINHIFLGSCIYFHVLGYSGTN
jgi:hypothetical protein